MTITELMNDLWDAAERTNREIEFRCCDQEVQLVEIQFDQETKTLIVHVGDI